jgi:hypothetical protein
LGENILDNNDEFKDGHVDGANNKMDHMDFSEGP